MTKSPVRKRASRNKKPVTRVAIVLDSSGSMSAIRDYAINTFNSQLATLRRGAKEQNLKVSLVTFAQAVNPPVLWNQDVKEAKELDRDSYNPEGGTAMYDAVGTTIEKLRNLKEAGDEGTSFLVIVISDGEENQSHLFSSYRLSDLIQQMQATGRWTFSYLGANQDLSKVAATLNIPIGNTMAFVASAAGMHNASNATNYATANYMSARAAGQSASKSFYDQGTPTSVQETLKKGLKP